MGLSFFQKSPLKINFSFFKKKEEKKITTKEEFIALKK
jgi:hypothetical protein